MTNRPLLGSVATAVEGLAALALLVLMLVVLADVVGRNLLNQPLPWGTELLEVLLAASIFLLHPVLAWRRGHVTVDLIALPRLAKAQRVFAGLIGATLFVIMTWALTRQALRASGYGETTPLLRLPLSWVFGGMALASAVTVLAFLLSMTRASPPVTQALDEMQP